MKLLFDENLSSRLRGSLSDLFPGSLHVEDVGLQAAGDEELRRYALQHERAIVTKDADSAEHCLLRGTPPKVPGIRRGNCSTLTVELLLRANLHEILAFDASDAPLLALL